MLHKTNGLLKIRSFSFSALNSCLYVGIAKYCLQFPSKYEAKI